MRMWLVVQQLAITPKYWICFDQMEKGVTSCGQRPAAAVNVMVMSEEKH